MHGAGREVLGTKYEVRGTRHKIRDTLYVVRGTLAGSVRRSHAKIEICNVLNIGASWVRTPLPEGELVGTA